MVRYLRTPSWESVLGLQRCGMAWHLPVRITPIREGDGWDGSWLRSAWYLHCFVPFSCRQVTDSRKNLMHVRESFTNGAMQIPPRIFTLWVWKMLRKPRRFSIYTSRSAQPKCPRTIGRTWSHTNIRYIT